MDSGSRTPRLPRLTSSPPLVHPTPSPTGLYHPHPPLPSSPILKGSPPRSHLYPLPRSPPSPPRVARQDLLPLYFVVELVIHRPGAWTESPTTAAFTVSPWALKARVWRPEAADSNPRCSGPGLEHGVHFLPARGSRQSLASPAAVQSASACRQGGASLSSWLPATSSPRAGTDAGIWLRLSQARGPRAAEGRKCARGPSGAHAPLAAGRAGHAPRAFWREARGGPDNESVRRLSQ